MGSTLILKFRICLKPFFHQGSAAFLSINTPVAIAACPSARFLCTRDTNHIPAARGRQEADRRSSRQAGGSHGIIRWPEERRRLDEEESGGTRKPFSPKSVFSAGHAKRTAEWMNRKSSILLAPEDEEDTRGSSKRAGKLQPPDRPLSAEEWRELKESLGNRDKFEIMMMQRLFATRAELDTAKSLLNFVATETGTLSYKLLLQYLTICEKGGYDEEVFDLYDIMQQSFPSLETSAYSLFIKSFSRTRRWREALGMLHTLKKVFTPSPRNYGDVITAAMVNGDSATAWALYDELMENGRIPHQDTWEALFQRVGRGQEEGGEGEEAKSHTEHHRRLLEVLVYMRENQIYPQQGLARAIKTWFESLSEQKWTGSWTTVTPDGVCRCCGTQLESIQLTDEEYQQLKDRVMADVIQGQDVFQKTTPEELEKFRGFVQRKPAFDVVVDGLNVANTFKQFNQSENLAAVVLELKRQGRSVLVLGRKHMLRPSKSWNSQNMNLIQQKADCFFTENISEDDPFLIYASLHSGNHCLFVSKDLMRDHKACLPDGATRRLFFKWQRGHQLVLDGILAGGRRVRFQSISRHDTIIQAVGDSWHIPYDDTEDRSSYEIPQRWLCLTKTH